MQWNWIQNVIFKGTPLGTENLYFPNRYHMYKNNKGLSVIKQEVFFAPQLLFRVVVFLEEIRPFLKII